jgi:thiosulfate sulfurtransferase
MSFTIQSISPQSLAALQATPHSLTLLDVRRSMARNQDATQIPGAQWRDPADWLDWKDTIRHDVSAVVYCVKGHEISQAMAASLAALGVQARYLEGGISGWKASGLAVEPIKRVSIGNG